MAMPSSSSSPPGARPGSYSHTEYENESLVARWQEALQQCSEDLRSHEMEAALHFRSPSDLMMDLKEKERLLNDRVMTQLIVQLYPALNALSHLCVLFLTVMPPHSIEMALFWGALHLVIRGCLASRVAMAKFVRMVDRLRQELYQFSEVAVVVEDRPELRYALVDLFVTLIDFWKETVRVNRKTVTEKFSEHLILDGMLGLQPKFDRALAAIEECVERLHRTAALSRLRHDAESVLRANEDILAMLAVSEDGAVRFPVYVLPSPPAFFYGRQTELKAIRDHLCVAAPVDHLRTFVVFGLGGVGKTALALAFADQIKGEHRFDVIFWISSETPAQIRRSFSEIALRMELPRAGKDMDSQNNIMVVRNWLGKTSQRWLCIYDNVEELSALDRCMPPGNGCVLFTTRYKHLSTQVPCVASRCEVNPFDAAESLNLFEGLWKSYDAHADPQEEREVAKTLLPRFDGLALGIEQVAAYITYRSCTLAQYAARYAQVAKSILRKGDGGRPAHTLATVWEVHFDNIAGTDASRLMGILSLLSPDFIPVTLLSLDEDEDTSESFEFCTDPIVLEETIDDLMRVALIKRSGDDLSLHRLVQQAFLYSPHGMQDQLVSHFATAVHMVRRKFPTSGGTAVMWGRWESCRICLPHAQTLAYLYTLFKLHKADLDCSFELVDLWKDCVWYLHEIGNHAEALELHNVAEKACKDKNSLQYAYLRSHAGCTHYAMKNMNSARECFMDAVRIREEKADANDPVEYSELANAYDNYGIERFSVGKYSEALELTLKGQKIRESKTGGELHKAVSNFHLGQIYAVQGRYQDAEEELDAAIRICDTQGSSGEFLRAFILLHRGNVDLLQDKIEEAQANYQEALTVLKRDGPTHRFTSTCYYKLRITAARRSNVQDAMLYMDKSQVIAEYQKKNGAVARCLHQKARMIEMLPEPTDQERADGAEWRFRASAMALQISVEGGGQTVANSQDENAYDCLLNGEER